MAEAPGGEGGGAPGGGRHQKKRAKKGRTHIDMTPMVDLAFLLLTFFILTTTMYKPSTLKLTYPVPPEEDQPPPPKVNNALTMFLTKKDQILYYVGGWKPETQLTRTNFTDVRKLLVEMNLPSVTRINEYTKQYNEGKIGEKALDSLKNLSHKMDDALYVIIKPDPDAKFRNVIDMVDEMDISGVGKFGVQDAIRPEEMALLETEQAIF